MLVDRNLVRGYFSTPDAYIEFVEKEMSARMAEELKPYLLEDTP